MSVLNIEESSSQTGMAYFNGTTRKYKEQFKLDVSNYIVKFLRVYRSPDSSGVVKITSDEDFKYLARKVCSFSSVFIPLLDTYSVINIADSRGDGKRIETVQTA